MYISALDSHVFRVRLPCGEVVSVKLMVEGQQCERSDRPSDCALPPSLAWGVDPSVVSLGYVVDRLRGGVLDTVAFQRLHDDDKEQQAYTQAQLDNMAELYPSFVRQISRDGYYYDVLRPTIYQGQPGGAAPEAGAAPERPPVVPRRAPDDQWVAEVRREAERRGLLLAAVRKSEPRHMRAMEASNFLRQ